MKSLEPINNIKNEAISRKKPLTLTFIFLFVGLCSLTANDSLRKYYQNVAQAERKICEEEYGQAALRYREAFSQKQLPFAVDLHNATLCEIKAQGPSSEKYCLSYLQLLLEKDVFDDRDFSANLLVFLEKHEKIHLVDSLKEKRRTSPSSEKKQRLSKMTQFDQAARILCPGYDPACLSSILYADSLNRDHLYTFMSKADGLDYFDENKVGYKQASNLRVILLHLNATFKKFETQAYLLEAVRKGIFDARAFAFLADRFYEVSNKETNDTLFHADYPGGPYGSFFILLFAEEASNVGRKGLTAFVDLDYSRPEMLKRIDHTNKNRREIFLPADVESTAEVSLCFARNNLNSLFKTANNLTYTVIPGLGRQLIQRFIDGGSKIKYYIEDEHDFGF